MSKYTRRLGTSLTLTFALVAATACAGGEKKDTLAQDTSALGRDLALAGQDSAAQPALPDTLAAAPAPAPAAPAPARAATPRRTTSGTAAKPATTTTRRTASGNTETRRPASGAASNEGGSVGTIAAGSQISLTSNDRVCTNTNKVGDTFTATVSEPVSGSNGATIPAGATVTLRVTELKRSENANDQIRMSFAVQSVSFGGKTYSLDASVEEADIERVRASTRGNDAKKVAAGAAVGAIAGQILGKSTKSTVIGAAAGAAAGAGAAAATANYEGCVGQAKRIVVRLNSSTQVKA
ncbi:MAG: hypothetical protein ACJ8AO_19665 [Gemmatimonadaceae bacterium]